MIYAFFLFDMIRQFKVYIFFEQEDYVNTLVIRVKDIILLIILA